jgi:hypothetical protein
MEVRRIRDVLTVAATVCAAVSVGSAQQPAPTLTRQRIEEAIGIASDDKAARSFLSRYAIQTHAGWGDGPRIGLFSTPFARIVQAAAASRRAGKRFSPADATPDDLAPELHVVVLFQPSAVGDAKDVGIESIAIGRRGITAAEVTEPIRTPALSPEYQSRYGLMVESPGIVAVFPLSAFAADRELRVTYREVVKGASAIANCRQCIVPFPVAGIQ